MLTAEDVVNVDVRIRFVEQLPSALDSRGGIHEGAIHIEEAVSGK